MSEKVHKEVPLLISVLGDVLKAKNFDQKAAALQNLGTFLQSSEFSQKVNGILIVFEVGVLIRRKQLNKNDFHIWLDQLLDWLETSKELVKNKRESERVLDLSNHSTKEDECLDLAKNISSVLNNPQTPERIYNAIQNELTNLDTSSDTYTTPEYIAKLLCNEVKG